MRDAGLGVLVVVALVVVLAIGFSGCTEEKKPAAPEYKVRYTPVAEGSGAYLKVRVEGEPHNLKVMLSDPEGTTVDTAYISEDDLRDGVEIVKLLMAEYGKTPEAGTYTLQILKGLARKLVYSKNLTFEGAKISIKSADFETTFYEFLEYGEITKVKLTVANDGDLPAIIDKGVIVAGSKSEEIPFFLERIPPKESKELTGSVYISELDKGEHPVTIKLYSGQKELAEYKKTVTIG